MFENNSMAKRMVPKGSILLYHETGIIERYFVYSIVALLVIIVEGMLIFYLYHNIRKRRVAEEELVHKEKDLQDSNIELSNTNEELVATNESLEASNHKLSVAFATIEDQQKEIFSLVYADALTGMNNRLAISEIIRRWITRATVGYQYMVLFLDVDNFKYINDTFGHEFGDKVIKETGKRLVTMETDELQIGRFGGDEFLIIARIDEEDMIQSMLQEVKKLFLEPISIEGRSFFLTISIGASLYPEHGRAQSELIKKADLALYEAKSLGKNRGIIFEKKLVERVKEKVHFQSFVRAGFENNEFYMKYQPHFDIIANRFTGVEALIRWKSEELGNVAPIKLIRAAEELGLIVEIGNWVLKEACIFGKQLHDIVDEELTISINISMVQLMHGDFLQSFQSIIEETGINPKKICLEMTETTMFTVPEDRVNIIEDIKDLGVTIALDDFGTGYSSLSYFKNIAASTIKIDKSFVDHIAEEKYDKYTVETIIKLAHHKGLKVIAEGVEEKKQLEVLRELSCDMIQGYYYSKPLKGEEIVKFLLDT